MSYDLHEHRDPSVIPYRPTGVWARLTCSKPSEETLPTVSSSIRGPRHYKRGKIEVWDFIRDQGLNYHLGNAIKYICRAGFKDSKVDDLEKAIHYLQNELEHSL